MCTHTNSKGSFTKSVGGSVVCSSSATGDLCDLRLSHRRLNHVGHQHTHATQLAQHGPAREERLRRSAPATATAAATCLTATAMAIQFQNKAQQQRMAHNVWCDFLNLAEFDEFLHDLCHGGLLRYGWCGGPSRWMANTSAVRSSPCRCSTAFWSGQCLSDSADSADSKEVGFQQKRPISCGMG